MIYSYHFLLLEVILSSALLWLVTVIGICWLLVKRLEEENAYAYYYYYYPRELPSRPKKLQAQQFVRKQGLFLR